MSSGEKKSFAKLPDRPVDLDREKTLYVVGYAHLDTQWRWAYPQVIREYIPNTMRKNFEFLEKYPNYVFNFSGARRYAFMKEYYPEDYARVKEYVASGRWFPCGSSVEETDVLMPGLESCVRNVLYGNQFFRREFGVVSEEFMLPDCFGFPACLPAMLAHCGIRGFSTQKLTWGSAIGIPFKVGVWEGIGGGEVIAALDPGDYIGFVTEDLSRSIAWNIRMEMSGKASGVFADYRYYGTGDIGGAPDEKSVRLLEESLVGTGPIRVVSATADQMVRDITPEQKARLPRYRGELLLTNHSAGVLTSQSCMKRWNRKNELLANAAESAAAAACILGALPYPGDKLREAWNLVLGSQMHDMLPGTSLPRAYAFCWNDEVLAANQFAAVLESSAAAVISGMETRVAERAVPLVVYNPLSIEREDVVEATISTGDDAFSSGVTVYDSEGRAMPTQIKAREEGRITILFLARVSALGFAVYEVRAGEAGVTDPVLRVTSSSLENERYLVRLDDAGDVSSIFDKLNGKEILRAPAQLVFQYENPKEFPAWNMDWEDRGKPPMGFVAGPARVTIVESGPARVSLRVERAAYGSKFVQQIRLQAGGNRMEFDCEIDWHTAESSLRAVFPLAVANPLATYDAQLGTIQRGNNEPKKFEVPQHQWMDLTARDGAYGISILNDCKYGSDKPDDETLRLTLLYTPGTRGGYHDQGTQDFGRHAMRYAVMGHSGSWAEAGTVWEAARLNQPLLAFTARSHAGVLGRSFSLFQVNGTQAQITAIKKAEEGDELIVRMRELFGHSLRDVRMTSVFSLVAAREIDGQEREIGVVPLNDGALVFDLEPYQVRAFAVKIGTPEARLAAPSSRALDLPYQFSATSSPVGPVEGAFDSVGCAYSAEEFPRELVCEGVRFKLGGKGKANALRCEGQTLELPEGDFNRVYVLASSVEGDQVASFKIGEVPMACTVQDWSEFIGQWDSRRWKGEVPELVEKNWTNVFDGLTPGYIKPGRVAWYGSHRHDAQKRDEFYQYTYLFLYRFDLTAGVRKFVLPENPAIRLFAASVANEPGTGTYAAIPLFDTLADCST